MFRRALSTLGCGTLSLEEARQLARRHGLDAIELRALDRSLDLPARLAHRYGSPAELADCTGDPAARVVLLGSSVSLVGATPADLEQLLLYAPWAEAFGARWIRVFDGGAGGHTGAELAEALATMAWWRTWRQQHGWKVDLAVETHDSLLTGDRIGRFARACPGVQILWDAHHTWRKGHEHPLMTWAKAAPHVVHIHVKDSRSAASPAGFEYVLPGTGEFPIRALLPVLRIEFAGCVSLEWERWWHPELPPLEEALASAENCHWW